MLQLLGELHVPILLTTMAVILYSDHQALLYFTGRKQILTAKFSVWSHRLVWLGLVAMIFSGVSLVAPSWQFYMSDPVFYIKIWFVLVLVINAVAIGKLLPLAQVRPFRELTPLQRTTLLVSGFLSGLSWTGAIILSYFFL